MLLYQNDIQQGDSISMDQIIAHTSGRLPKTFGKGPHGQKFSI